MTDSNFIGFFNNAILYHYYIFLFCLILNRKIVNSYSEIIIKLNGRNDQAFISGDHPYTYDNHNDKFEAIPDEIYINGAKQNYTGYKALNLQQRSNTIRIVFYNKLTSCVSMFNGLTNIIEVDLSQFDASLVTNMYRMFCDCTSLKSINFGNFNTSNCVNMRSMFNRNLALLDLNLSSFDTSKVTEISFMFENYPLPFINLYTFSFASIIKYETILKYSNQNLIFCINEETIHPDIKLYLEETFKSISNCSMTCNDISNIKKLKDKNICVKKCNYNSEAIYKYEINNTCYRDIPIGYFANEELLLEKCFNICKFCIGFGNEVNNSCTECFPGFILIKNNCYNICDFYYYFHENEYFCTDNNSCPKDYNKLIPDKKECIDNCLNDEMYKYEYNNQCYYMCPNDTMMSTENDFLCKKIYPIDKPSDTIVIEESDGNCSAGNLFIGKCDMKIDDNDITLKDDILLIIKEDLKNGNLNTSLLNLLEGDKEDLIYKYDNTIYQFTTNNNQNNNNYTNYNISIIKLNECEKELKDFYKIPPDEPLLMLKIDLYEPPDALTPIVEYEIYNSKTREVLNLSVCNNTKIEILLPSKNIDEEELFKYDPSSDYYRDICFSYTTEKGTDIPLSDRNKEYVNNSLCDEYCDYKGYDNETKLVKCECEIKINLPLISEISIDKSLLYKKIYSYKNIINLDIMKCYKVLLTKEGLKSNICSFILLSMISLFFLLLFVFIIKGKELLFNKINNLLLNANQQKQNQNNRKKANRKKANSRNKTLIKRIRKKGKVNISIKKKKNKNNIKKSKYLSIMKTSGSRKILFSKQKSVMKNINNNTNNKLLKYKLNDYQLNNLKYNDALTLDKRDYCSFYLSLIKRRQIVIFSFYTYDDYNSKSLKITLFFFSFSLTYSINTLFFDESNLHQIYIDNGLFNIIYQLPKIIYTTLVSSIIYLFVKYFSLSEENILGLKERNECNKRKISELENCLIKKFIMFFLLIFVFLVFFWFYISCFCVINKNTQVYLIKETLISYGLSLLYPFGSCLLPGIFRIPALRDANRKREGMYKFSKFIQII